jgi:predicted outer membrane repeat protein
MHARIHQKTIGNFLLALFLIMGAFGAQQTPHVLAATLTVTNTNDSGPGSLRQAIADAHSGDVITFDLSLAGQTITLTSDIFINPGTTQMVLTIDGSGLMPQVTISGGDVAHLKFSPSTDITISDLTIVHGYGGAIEALGKLTISNSTLKNNQGYAIQSSQAFTVKDSTIKQNQGGGIAITVNGDNSSILNSTINQNTAGRGGGIAILGNGAVSILNSTITQNSAAKGGGIYVSGNAVVDVSDSTFADNSAPQGAEVMMTGSTAQIRATNTIFVCTPGNSDCYTYIPPWLGINTTNSILGVGNLADYGLAALADNGGPTQTMALLPGSSLIDAGNDADCAATDQRGVPRPQKNHCDIGAYEYENLANVRYVKQDAGGLKDGSSWSNAYTDLQSALAATFPEEEIWVAAGIYKPGTDRDATFILRQGVALYGGFAGNEVTRGQRDPIAHGAILSGDLNGNDNSTISPAEPTRAENVYHVISSSSVGNTSILDGFTITGGNANLNRGQHTARGGGMWNGSASPTLRNVILQPTLRWSWVAACITRATAGRCSIV